MSKPQGLFTLMKALMNPSSYSDLSWNPLGYFERCYIQRSCGSLLARPHLPRNFKLYLDGLGLNSERREWQYQMLILKGSY